MKALVPITLLLTAALSVALMSGCVGYNTTMTMSKSNAGLDVDTKPPTLEANISRKEIVVAPAFEGGQTPPIMASFGSKSGSGGSLGRFFFGVNQTFAGGDAALTMAKLYNHPSTPADDATSKANFDSGILLSKMPSANSSKSALKRKLFALAEPGEVRPFVFGTDTQLGVKIGWTGMGSPAPETIKIGFNRKEIAVAPLTVEENSSSSPKSYTARIPSFLATVDTDVQVGGDARIAWIQYFATGSAANHLARRPQVRAAMLTRADPEQTDAFAAIKKQGAMDAEILEKQVAEIVAKVTVKDTTGVETVDSGKLDTITAGVPGWDSGWKALYAGKPPEKLRSTLLGADQGSVPALHANLSKIP